MPPSLPTQRPNSPTPSASDYKARIKQAVVKVVRRSSIEDLRDPQLDLFKRNLKTEINNVLPERYVQEIIVADIRTMQQ